MKYYLIYLESDIVTNICSFDDEIARDNAYYYWVYRDQNIDNQVDYDEIQCLNVIQ